MSEFLKKKINLKNVNYLEKRVINLPIRESLKKKRNITYM